MTVATVITGQEKAAESQGHAAHEPSRRRGHAHIRWRHQGDSGVREQGGGDA
jgi:hypothetical protein